MTKYGGTVTALGKLDPQAPVQVGDTAPRQALVLVEWPSREAFQGFLDDPDHADLHPLRERARATTCGGPTRSSRTCGRCSSSAVADQDAAAGRDRAASSRLPRRSRWTQQAPQTVATGTARKAPAMPAIVPPAATETSTTIGCSFSRGPMTTGYSTLPSTCWTTTIATPTISASVGPPATSATSTAAAPATIAPMIGKNAASHVSTISGSASGTPTSSSTAPISTASTVATKTTPRV